MLITNSHSRFFFIVFFFVCLIIIVKIKIKCVILLLKIYDNCYNGWIEEEKRFWQQWNVECIMNGLICFHSWQHWFTSTLNMVRERKIPEQTPCLRLQIPSWRWTKKSMSRTAAESSSEQYYFQEEMNYVYSVTSPSFVAAQESTVSHSQMETI